MFLYAMGYAFLCRYPVASIAGSMYYDVYVSVLMFRFWVFPFTAHIPTVLSTFLHSCDSLRSQVVIYHVLHTMYSILL